jgi:hypothetical protein
MESAHTNAALIGNRTSRFRQETYIVNIKKSFMAPALLAAAAAGSIAFAPAALAADTGQPPNCTTLSSSSTQCQTPGNVQITATPPGVPYAQQYPYFGGFVILDHGGHGMGGHR